jgi:hypothetical protein
MQSWRKSDPDCPFYPFNGNYIGRQPQINIIVPGSLTNLVPSVSMLLREFIVSLLFGPLKSLAVLDPLKI